MQPVLYIHDLHPSIGNKAKDLAFQVCHQITVGARLALRYPQSLKSEEVLHEPGIWREERG